ncbi:MAG: hypothetical protein ACKVS6_03880 [Planctomycetota bacterium]
MSELREFLEGIVNYLKLQERGPGELWCSKHKIEHTGTGAYTSLLCAYLLQIERRDEWLQLGLRVALRVCDRVKEDPKESYGTRIVLPGSRDPHNHSNNAIDCGCAIDSLATFARLCGDWIPKDALTKIESAVRTVVDHYIKPYAITKEILAQRLWSLAALGSAYHWLKEPEWKTAGLAALEKTYLQQNGDGSFPYTPLGTPRSHEGSSDASAFYHSRHALFIMHALRSFGEDTKREPHAGRVRAASDFLLALRRAGGLKTTLVEAKPWYWNSDYEVAGFPFDISALSSAGAEFGELKYRAASAKMLNILFKHAEPDRGITSHRGPQWNFQCRFFWNAHCAWLARERETLEKAKVELTENAAAPARELRWFPDAGFAQYQDSKIIIQLRGKKPRANINHGSAFGGGGLLHAAAHAEPGVEFIQKRLGDRYLSAEWHVVPDKHSGLAARLQKLQKAWKENKDEFRFCSWIARVRARSGDVAGAAGWYLNRWVRGLAWASRNGYSSGYATKANAERVENTLAFRGGVADMFGDALENIETIRRYVFENGGVRVGDALVIDRDLNKCIYRFPPGAIDAAADGSGAKVERGIVNFGKLKKGAMVAVRYQIRAK